jgi:hypothetical protein
MSWGCGGSLWRLNANISVWLFSYLEPKLDIVIEYQILFGTSK